MPEISRFYGIVDINTLAVISRSLPPRAMGLVTEWTLLHRDELLDFWNRASNLEPIGKIDPFP